MTPFLARWHGWAVSDFRIFSKPKWIFKRRHILLLAFTNTPNYRLVQSTPPAIRAAYVEMSESSKPIIAVSGATGAQGGSVVRVLLKDGGFHIRALTRNVESPAAKGTSKQAFN